MDGEVQQSGGQSAIISLPNDGTAMTIFKAFVAPVLVAIAVGMGTAYFTAQDALARFDERQQQQGEQIGEVQDDVEGLESSERELSEQIQRLAYQIDRLEEIEEQGNE